MKKSIEQILAEHAGPLMKLSGVAGLAKGLCNGEPCIKIYVAEDTPELRKHLPASIEGILVRVEQVGDIRALQ